MVPMCRRLLDPALLTPPERVWLDAYHAEVREKTRGFFEREGKGKDVEESAEDRGKRERALEWLLRETEKFG